MEELKRICDLITEVREKKPLVHQITNYVTVNDCANITLAVGASPVMADDKEEVCDMVSLSSSLVINIGTLNSRTVESMILAGKKANELNIPVVLDPVGAGATKYRTEISKRIIKEVKLAAIRGNFSEVKTLCGIDGKTKGVDSSEDISNSSLENAKVMAKNLAKELNTTIAITGPIDIITDGNKIFCIENGHSIMSKVTGTGCMCTSVIGAFVGANKDYFSSVVGAVLTMGIAGEIAYENLNKTYEGTGSYKVRLIDAVYSISAELMGKRGKVYEG